MVHRFQPVADLEPDADAVAVCAGEMLTVTEACQRARVSRPTLRQWRRMGLRVIQHCERGRLLIPAAELTRFLAERLKQ